MIHPTQSLKLEQACAQYNRRLIRLAVTRVVIMTLWYKKLLKSASHLDTFLLQISPCFLPKYCASNSSTYLPQTLPSPCLSCAFFIQMCRAPSNASLIFQSASPTPEAGMITPLLICSPFSILIAVYLHLHFRGNKSVQGALSPSKAPLPHSPVICLSTRETASLACPPFLAEIKCLCSERDRKLRKGFLA